MNHDSSEPSSDAQSVYLGFWHRLSRGEDVDFEDLCATYPEIVEELRRIHEQTVAFGSIPVATADEKRLGDYRIVREIGRGGMGQVFEAIQGSLGRRVALKVLPGSFTIDPTRVERFRREARATARLHHPSIVPVYDVGEVDGTHYYSMEYIDGVSLADSISADRDRLGKTPGKRDTSTSDPAYVANVVDRMANLAEGLQEAHALGLVHRDIKPSNIIVERKTGRWVLVDFGLVHDEASHAITRSGEMLGTYYYMSPEQVARRKVDARSDVYSLGTTLYQALTLHAPFELEGEHALQEAILFEDPISPRKLNSRVNRDLEAIVYRALEKKPSRRYASAGEFAADLRRFLAYEPVVASPRSRIRSAARKLWGQRVRWTAALAILLAIALGLTLGVGHGGPMVSVTDFVRVTTDVGLTTDPALSADGSLLVYASDRATGEDLDVWAQPVEGGEPRRLTSHPLDDREPVVSPSGTQVAFRSERDGGGVYVVSIKGGEATTELLAPRGRRPRYSPDGQWIAYWTGPIQHESLLHGEVFLVEASGGKPRRLTGGFGVARYPVWSPDGSRVLFVGRLSRDAPSSPMGRRLDLFTVFAAGGGAVETGIYESLLDAGATSISSIIPGTWLSGEDLLFCAAATSHGSNLWAVKLDLETGRALGPAEVLRRGTQHELNPWVTNQAIVFSSAVSTVDLFSVPLDPESGLRSGEIVRLTRSGDPEYWPSVSRDGARVTYSTGKYRENGQIWLLDLGSRLPGARRITVGTDDEYFPLISEDGSRVTFESRGAEGLDRSGILDLESGDVVLLPSIVHAWDWSTDGSEVIVWPTDEWPRASLSVIDVSSGLSHPVIQSDTYAVYQGNLSPDGSRLCFNAVPTEGDSRVFVAPYRTGEITPESEWTPLTDGKTLSDKPRWSADGSLVYYVSDKDGFRCIYAQRIDRATGRPVEDPIEIAHFHTSGRSLANLGIGRLEISVARDKLVFNMAAVTGSVWKARLEDR